jgi:hypothetical protein
MLISGTHFVYMGLGSGMNMKQYDEVFHTCEDEDCVAYCIVHCTHRLWIWTRVPVRNTTANSNQPLLLPPSNNPSHMHALLHSGEHKFEFYYWGKA